jgi:hypothetical protein
MIIVPPRHYCTIVNPVIRDTKEDPLERAVLEKAKDQKKERSSEELLALIKQKQASRGSVVMDKYGRQTILQHSIDILTRTSSS